MQQIMIITGSYPPDVCGVGDYTHSLLSALSQQATEPKLFYRKDWSLQRLTEYWRFLRCSTPATVAIQYPTEGYGYSILPQLLCFLLWRKQRIVNLHEFSRKSLKGKLAIYLFFLSGSHVIFTSDAEYQSALRVAPWLRRNSRVVPIGSNIPFHGASRESGHRDLDVVYFGQIRPHKGIEEFLEVIAAIQYRQKYSAALIGQTAAGYESYADSLLQRARVLGIDLVLNVGADEVSRRLSMAKIALLPFPDGISTRRGSALAAMGNGALLLTIAPKKDVERFRPISLMENDAAALPDLLVEALTNYPKYEGIRSAGIDYARSFSWGIIAEHFNQLALECHKQR